MEIATIVSTVLRMYSSLFRVGKTIRWAGARRQRASRSETAARQACGTIVAHGCGLYLQPALEHDPNQKQSVTCLSVAVRRCLLLRASMQRIGSAAEQARIERGICVHARGQQRGQALPAGAQLFSRAKCEWLAGDCGRRGRISPGGFSAGDGAGRGAVHGAAGAAGINVHAGAGGLCARQCGRTRLSGISRVGGVDGRRWDGLPRERSGVVACGGNRLPADAPGRKRTAQFSRRGGDCDSFRGALVSLEEQSSTQRTLRVTEGAEKARIELREEGSRSLVRRGGLGMTASTLSFDQGLFDAAA